MQIGDKVKFLNDVGGGTVTGFVNKKTVNIEDADGFEIPYPISQLVNISENERNEKAETTAEILQAEATPAKEIIQEKEAVPEPKVQPKPKPADIVEVDLHIRELLESTSGMSKKEMLDIQLAKVVSEMQAAISANVKRIVFIHGLGQGVLKQEVAKLLKSKFPKYYFQDASFKEYGYGATMVVLKRGN